MTALRTREHYEAEERERLAPAAVKSAESRGRIFGEPEHAYRTAFQRDRDAHETLETQFRQTHTDATMPAGPLLSNAAACGSCFGMPALSKLTLSHEVFQQDSAV